MKETYKYKAFISYSHQDQKFAKWLHKKIENYKIPKSLREKYPDLPKDLKRTIFLDDEELPTASALPDNLSHALESSELLIVVCSPNATQSYWVDKEIAYFKQYHGEGKVLAVLKEGEPNATYSTVYDSNQEAFPKSLRYKVKENGELAEERTEPLAADARKGANKKKALIKLIAGILKVDFADLWERDKKEARKRRMVIGLILTLFVALSIYASIQFLGEQGNKELEKINKRIEKIEYSIRHDELPVEKAIALNKELKKLKKDKENKEASQEALGKLNTSLGKKAKRIYEREGVIAAIEILTGRPALADQDARLKDVSKEKLATAKMYVEIHEFDKAEENYKKATEIFFDYENAYEYAGFLNKQNDHHKATLLYKKILQERLTPEDKGRVLNHLGELNMNMNKLKESESLLNQSVTIIRTLAKDNPDKYNADLMISLGNLAIVYSRINKFNEAEKTYNEIIKLGYLLVQKNPDKYNILLAQVLGNLAALFLNNNKYIKAEQNFNKSIKVLHSLVQIDSMKYKPYLAGSLGNLANLYQETNRFHEAEEAHHEVVKIFRSLIKINPSAYTPELALRLGNLGNLYLETNMMKEAEEVYTESVSIYRTLVELNSDVYNPELARTLGNLGILYSNLNMMKEAEEVYTESVLIYRTSIKTNPDEYNKGFAHILLALAGLYNKTNRFKEFEKAYNEAVKIKKTIK